MEVHHTVVQNTPTKRIGKCLRSSNPIVVLLIKQCRESLKMTNDKSSKSRFCSERREFSRACVLKCYAMARQEDTPSTYVRYSPHLVLLEVGCTRIDCFRRLHLLEDGVVLAGDSNEFTNQLQLPNTEKHSPT